MPFAISLIEAAGPVSPTGTPIWLVFVAALMGAGGVGGVITAILKIRPDTDNAAVSQAQGANETLVELNDRLKSDLDSERARRIQTEEDLATARNTIKTLQDVMTGVRIMQDDKNFPLRGEEHKPAS